MLSVGDLVRVTVHTTSPVDASEALETVEHDEELASILTPLPSGAGLADRQQFGVITLLQEFVVATTAELTAAGICATIQAALARRRASRAEPAPAHVTVNVPEDGICEVMIRIDRRSTSP